MPNQPLDSGASPATMRAAASDFCPVEGRPDSTRHCEPLNPDRKTYFDMSRSLCSDLNSDRLIMKELSHPKPTLTKNGELLLLNLTEPPPAPIHLWVRVTDSAPPAPPSKPTNSVAPREKQLLSAEEVAQVLGIGERTVWRHRQAGRLPPPLAVGGRTLWHRADIEDWIREKKRAAANQRPSTRHNKHRG